MGHDSRLKDIMSTSGPSAAVVVITYRRPDYVRTCLQHLEQQSLEPHEILVVDSSPDHDTERVVADFDGVRYLRHGVGRGHTASSRALGVARTSAEIVAFVDDDAYAEPDWLEQLLIPYGDQLVGGVGGRARNNQPGEESEGVDRVGLLLPDGHLTGNFAAVTPGPLDVDHLIGCNMSYRRSALEKIGGIHDHWPGTCLREDADPGLRLRRAGYRLVYTPWATVLHVGGSYAKGRRFDLRYTYFGARNHVVLLQHALGPHAPQSRRYAGALLGDIARELRYAGSAVRDVRRTPYRRARGLANGLSRAAALAAGTVVGVVASLGVREGVRHEPVKQPTRPDPDAGR